MNLKPYLFLLLLFTSLSSIAQEQVVKGLVQDAYGPLIGATIIEKGTANGTQTDIEGYFELSVPEEATLEISYVGYTTQTLLVPADGKINIIMQEGSQLQEVVVVAQGLSKSKKALGYAVSKVGTDETEGRPEADISRTLQGKISGVQISPPNGSSGAESDIVIRGNLSFSDGNNDALIVLNNIPFDGNLLDIDPNDIKNITVLKGLNAAVLYGNAGRNGVILIETKSGNAELGEKNFEVKASSTTYFNTVSNLPNLQNSYGVGNNFITDAGTLQNNGSYGAAFSDVDLVDHPLAYDERFPQFAGLQVPYEAAENNVRDFFDTGIGQTYSLGINATGESASFNASLGYTSEDGIIGNNSFKRFNVSVGGTAKVSDKLNISSSLSYIRRDRVSQTGNDVFEYIYRIPRNLDIHNLPYQDPISGANAFYRAAENPLWTLNNTGRERTVDRLTTSLNLNYEINKHHNISYRGGIQLESSNAFDFRNRGGQVTVSRRDIDETIRNTGTLELNSTRDFVIDNTIMLQSNYALSPQIGFNSQVGVNSRLLNYSSTDAQFTDQLVYGFFRPNNFRNNSSGDYDVDRENQAGFFGQFDFDYNNYLFLGLSGRYDISSTTEAGNQTLFYPGVSVSFLPTSAFKNLRSDKINYLKIRAAYATSAGFPGRYSTRNKLISNPREFQDPNGNLVVTNSLLSELGNLDLRPELHQEVEAGIEGKFFNNIVTLEASVFNRISKDQIFEIELDGSTGFTSTTINAGRLDSRGIEIDLGIDLIKNHKNFNWNIRNTFTSFSTTVKELIPGVDRFVFDSNPFPGVDAVAIVGRSLGSFVGSYIVRDQEGNALVDPNNGTLLISDEVGLEDQVIGDIIPDWRATMIHTLSYKNIRLSGQFEYTKGGSATSEIIEDTFERGTSAATENREGSFVIPGIYGDPSTGEAILDENGNTIRNTIQNNGNRNAFSNFYEGEENFTFDASVFRIRELSLSYTLNQNMLAKLPFEDVVFTFTGRNVFHYAPNFPKGTNIDPEVVDYDFPTTRRYSLGLSLKF